MNQRIIFYNRFTLFLCCVALCAVSVSVADADTVLFGASKDSTLINESSGNAANGTGDLFSGETGNRGPGALRALLAFDIASNVPAGSTVTDVQVTLNVLKVGNGAGVDDYTLHTVAQDWGEGASFSTAGPGVASSAGDATWIHTFHDTSAWTNPGGDFNSTPSAVQSIGDVGPVSWKSPDLVADVQSWLDDPATNFGWILIGDESLDASARKFSSREAAANAPALMVTFTPVPEPSSGVILLLVLIGGAAWSRRRSR